MRRETKRKEEKKQKKRTKRVLLAGMAVALVVGGIKAVTLISGDKWKTERPVNPESMPEAGEQGMAGPWEKPTGEQGEEPTGQADGQKGQAEEKAEKQTGQPTNLRFSDLYYYEKGRERRYAAYQQLYPQMSADQVVFRVNAELDRPFYTHIQTITDVKTGPLVPNKYHKLPDSFVPKNLVSLSSGRQVTESTKQAFERLQQDAAEAGVSIRDTSAYRSIAYQEQVYDRYLQKDSHDQVDTYSSRPGHSDHHTGEAIDLVGPKGDLTDFTGTPEAAWVAENAWKYGFIVRFPKGQEDVTGYMYEPWHIRYVGKEIAELMKDEKIATLEEYQVKYMEHTPPAIE